MVIRIVIRWSPGVMARRRRAAGTIVDRLCCLIAGHRDEIAVGGCRLALHCRRCGRTSPGWQLDSRRPV